jgi:signal transduction histidine kinase
MISFTHISICQAIQAGISFGVDMNQDEKSFFHDIVVNIDEFKINQVLRNLLSNAMKFTPKKGSVRIKTSVGGLSMGQHSIRGNGFYHEPQESNWWNTVKSLLSFTANEEDDASMSFNAPISRSGNGQTTNNGSPFPLKAIGPAHIDGCKFIGMVRISIVDSGPGISKVY